MSSNNLTNQTIMKPFFHLLLLAGGLLTYLPAEAHSGLPYPAANTQKLELVFSGTHLKLYTTGVQLNVGRNRKAGIWRVPARKVTEMWVQRKGEASLIPLHPHRFQRQLTELLPDYPEVHNYVANKEFLYKNLAKEIKQLDSHLEKVLEVRKEKQSVGPQREQIIGK